MVYHVHSALHRSGAHDDADERVAAEREVVALPLGRILYEHDVPAEPVGLHAPDPVTHEVYRFILHTLPFALCRKIMKFSSFSGVMRDISHYFNEISLFILISCGIFAPLKTKKILLIMKQKLTTSEKIALSK